MTVPEHMRDGAEHMRDGAEHMRDGAEHMRDGARTAYCVVVTTVTNR
ncbi:hypothetical protein [Streptomyces pseudogriseolus]